MPDPDGYFPFSWRRLVFALPEHRRIGTEHRVIRFASIPALDTRPCPNDGIVQLDLQMGVSRRCLQGSVVVRSSGRISNSRCR